MTMPAFTRGEWVDIGGGNKIRRVFRDGVLEALDWDHSCSNPAEDYIPLRHGPSDGSVWSNHAWEIQSEEPLTISPSLLCTACKKHGFIRGGAWVEA